MASYQPTYPVASISISELCNTATSTSLSLLPVQTVRSAHPELRHTWPNEMFASRAQLQRKHRAHTPVPAPKASGLPTPPISFGSEKHVQWNSLPMPASAVATNPAGNLRKIRFAGEEEASTTPETTSNGPTMNTSPPPHQKSRRPPEPQRQSRNQAPLLLLGQRNNSATTAQQQRSTPTLSKTHKLDPYGCASANTAALYSDMAIQHVLTIMQRILPVPTEDAGATVRDLS